MPFARVNNTRSVGNALCGVPRPVVPRCRRQRWHAGWRFQAVPLTIYSDTDSGDATRSYQGSGSYHVTVDGVGVSGTVTDYGSENSNYKYTTEANYSGGAWHATGSGGSSDNGNNVHSYTGHGHTSSSTSASGVSRQFYAWVIEAGGDNGEWDYQTTAKYSSGSGWSESGSGTASGSTSASFLYHDLAITTVNQSSSGPNGSTSTHSTTTVTHLIHPVAFDGHIDHFELLDDGWFENSHAAWGGDSDERNYSYASQGNASAVAYGGDYNGGNGSRDVNWSKWNDSHTEDDKTGQSWSTLTQTPLVGPPVTTGTASGGEEANGTDDHNDSEGWEHDEKQTSPGYAYSGMSASSNSMSRTTSTKTRRAGARKRPPTVP
jgi:hypothetical protein